MNIMRRRIPRRPLISVGRYYYAALMYEACIDRLPDRTVYWQTEMDQAKQMMG